MVRSETGITAEVPMRSGFGTVSATCSRTGPSMGTHSVPPIRSASRVMVSRQPRNAGPLSCLITPAATALIDPWVIGFPSATSHIVWSGRHARPPRWLSRTTESSGVFDDDDVCTATGTAARAFSGTCVQLLHRVRLIGMSAARQAGQYRCDPLDNSASALMLMMRTL